MADLPWKGKRSANRKRGTHSHTIVVLQGKAGERPAGGKFNAYSYSS